MTNAPKQPPQKRRTTRARVRTRASRAELILIGPCGAGKSTLARTLARALDVPCVSLDQLRPRYHADGDYEPREAMRRLEEESFLSLHEYRRPYDAEAVARALAEHAGCVFDFGAGHSCFEDAKLFATVARELAPCANVFRVLPSATPEESVHVLERRRGALRSGGVDLLDRFVRHPSGAALAKHTVFTAERSSSAVCREILQRADLTPALRASALARLGDDAAPPPQLDRSSYHQHLDAWRARFTWKSNFVETSEELLLGKRVEQLDRMAVQLGEPLPPEAVTFVNACFEEVERFVRPVLETARVSEPARERGLALYAQRLEEEATLHAMLDLDPFHGVLPFLDEAILAPLLQPRGDRGGPPREVQRDALHHRFLHRPQQSRYIFLHEMTVSWALNHFENGGRIKRRGELRLNPPTYSEAAAYFAVELARASGLSPEDFFALHLEDNEAIERALPPAVRDLLVVSAQLYSYLELQMTYRWSLSIRHSLSTLLSFFSIPSLERIASGRIHGLRADAGAVIDREFFHGFYGAPLAADGALDRNEHDLVSIASRLVDQVWDTKQKSKRR